MLVYRAYLDFVFSRVDIEVVVREKDDGRALSANEAIDVLNQERVKDHLKSQNYKVNKVTMGELN